MNAQRGSPTLGSASIPTEPWGVLIRPVNTDRVCRDAYLAKKVRYTVVARGRQATKTCAFPASLGRPRQLRGIDADKGQAGR